MPQCSNYTGKLGKFGKTVKLHKLPKNPALRRSWIRAISRKNWCPTNYTRVCSDHFHDGTGPDRKQSWMVPTENLAQKRPSQVSATPRRNPPTLRSGNADTTTSTVADNVTKAKQELLNIHTYVYVAINMKKVQSPMKQRY